MLSQYKGQIKVQTILPHEPTFALGIWDVQDCLYILSSDYNGFPVTAHQKSTFPAYVRSQIQTKSVRFHVVKIISKHFCLNNQGSVSTCESFSESCIIFIYAFRFQYILYLNR